MRTFLRIIFTFLAGYMVACQPSGTVGEIKEADHSIAKGQAAFTQNCSTCHNFKRDDIGPRLGGVTEQVTDEWIKTFIKNPQAVIESGDERALVQYSKFKVYMPPFGHLSDEEVDYLVAFMATQPAPATVETSWNIPEIKDPVPEKVIMTDLVVDLEEITRFPATAEKPPLARINKMDYRPDNGKLYLSDLNGKLYELDEGQPKLYLDMGARHPDFINKPGLGTGFGSFAFHPEFGENGLLYTTHAEPPATEEAYFQYDDSIKVTVQWVFKEWKTDDPEAFPFAPLKSRELFRIDFVTGIHGLQEVTFNPFSKPGGEDYGFLYLSIGDGAAAEEGFPHLVHNREMPWGTIFRIDPLGRNSPNGQYGIPASNPFANDGNAKTLGEIYAFGFRNPHRITWSSKGQMLGSHIGQQQVDGLNIILPGHDYGWPVREGTFMLNAADRSKLYPLPADDSLYNVTYPAAQFDHDEMRAISGGFEYVGKAIPELKGKYLFGCIVTGRFFYVNINDLVLGEQATIYGWNVTFDGVERPIEEQCGSKRVDLRFGRDADGEMYVFTKADGRLYRMKRVRGE